MKNKTESTTRALAEEEIQHIASFLPHHSQDLSHFLLARKDFFCAIQPERKKLNQLFKCLQSAQQNKINTLITKHPEFKIHQLLWHLAHGHENTVRSILQKKPQLLLKQGAVIDPSGRYFHQITPFQLALWTLDIRYMGGMLLDFIPPGTEGDDIRAQLLRQYNKVMTKGVRYVFQNTIIDEHCFNFAPLKNAMSAYIQRYNHEASPKTLQVAWCKGVGKEQAILPMHIRHHYCNQHELFGVSATFDKKTLKRTLQFSDVENKQHTWGTTAHQPGTGFALLRADQSRPIARTSPNGDDVQQDLETLAHLEQIRKKEIEAVQLKLQSLSNELKETTDNSAYKP